MYVKSLALQIVFLLFEPAVGHEAVCVASAPVVSVMAPLQVPTMSFFDDCFLKTGVVTSGDLPTIAFILDCGELQVTDEDLQPHVAAMHPDGECALIAADMRQLGCGHFILTRVVESQSSRGAEEQRSSVVE